MKNKPYIRTAKLNREDYRDLFQIYMSGKHCPAFRLFGPVLMIEDIFVPPQDRRKGTATRMMRELIASYKSSIVLNVCDYEDNGEVDLFEFYAKFGFIRLPNDCMYRNPPDTGIVSK